MIIVRESVLEDAKAINRLSEKELGYTHGEKETRKTLEWLLNHKEDGIFVAVDGTEVVGYIHGNYYVSLYAKKMSNIMGIAVNQTYQNQGIGRLLLKRLEQWTVDNGLSGVRLVSGETRTNAHQFYEHCGYAFSKKQMNYLKFF